MNKKHEGRKLVKEQCLTYKESRSSELGNIEDLRINLPIDDEALYKTYVDGVQGLLFPNLDRSIVKALIYTESNYQPDVYSSAGAVGLMQVIPKYHAWRMEKYNLIDIWDPYTNIVVGMDLLNEFYDKYNGDWYTILYHYSGGSSIYPNLVLERAKQYK